MEYKNNGSCKNCKFLDKQKCWRDGTLDATEWNYQYGCNKRQSGFICGYLKHCKGETEKTQLNEMGCSDYVFVLTETSEQLKWDI